MECWIVFLIFQRSHIVRTPKRSRALFIPSLAEKPIPVDKEGDGWIGAKLAHRDRLGDSAST